MPYEKPRAWLRLRVVGFEAYGVRLGRPLYLEAGSSRSPCVREWHFTTQVLRAWVGTERDARPLIRRAAESDAWDFDLALEVDDGAAEPRFIDPRANDSPPLVTRGERP